VCRWWIALAGASDPGSVAGVGICRGHRRMARRRGCRRRRLSGRVTPGDAARARSTGAGCAEWPPGWCRLAPPISTLGRTRSSTRGSCQDRWPSRASTAGTKVMRTMKASISTPIPRPKAMVLLKFGSRHRCRDSGRAWRESARRSQRMRLATKDESPGSSYPSGVEPYLTPLRPARGRPRAWPPMRPRWRSSAAVGLVGRGWRPS
jgi:hypothetical protein